MKTNVKNKYLVVLTAILIACMAFMLCFSGGSINNTLADEAYIDTPTHNITVLQSKDAGFYMVNGASVHVEKSAIRFETVVSKGYLTSISGEGLEVEFIATAQAVGGQKKTLKFPYQPKFSQSAADTDTITLSTVLDFTNYELTANEEQLKAIYQTEFITDSYVKITDLSNDTVRYEKAYKADDCARSMQVVANEDILNDGDVDRLSKYLTSENRSEKQTGFVSIEDGSAKVSIPNKTFEENETVDVFVNAKKYNGTVDEDGKIVLANVALKEEVKGGDSVNVSIFENNSVWSTKVVAADMALTHDTISVLHDISKEGEEYDGLRNKYYVLADNVDMSDITWSTHSLNYNSTKFTGTLDGQGYTISNFKPSYSGSFLSELFSYVDGATIKDLQMIDITLTRLSSTLATRAKDLKVENVSIVVKELAAQDDTQSHQSGIAAINLGNMSLKNVYVQFPDAALSEYASINQPTCYISAHTSNTVSMNNVCFVYGKTLNGGQIPLQSDVSKLSGTYSVCVDLTDIYQAVYGANKIISDTNDIAKNLVDSAVNNKQLVVITRDNIQSVLPTLTNELVVLGESINFAAHSGLSKITWSAYGSKDYQTKIFSGIFNGCGYTISNFETAASTYNGSLFAKVTGTIKNLIMKDAVAQGTNAIITGRSGQKSSMTAKTVATAIYENIFITVSSKSNTNAAHQQSAIASVNESSTFNNVVISMPNNIICGTKAAFVAAGPYCFELGVDGLYMIGGALESGKLFIASDDGVECGVTKTDLATAAQANADYYYYDDAAGFAGAFKTNGANSFLQYAYRVVYGN